MRFSKAFSALAVAALLAAPAAARAQTVTIKLGTLAPDGSTWHNLLKEMGERWSEASGGKVKLKIFAGGVAGNEGDMVAKMRRGQMQAAALTVIGLHDIETSAQAIAAPGLITNDAEWDYVFNKLQPVWEKRLIEKGFVPLMWGDTGWIHMFFAKNLKTPKEMRGTRVFAWAGDPASVEGWRVAGFQPVVISSTDILPSLTTGMIDGFATIPMMAFTARYYERAPYMVDAPWGHLPGGTVVRKETWDKIPPDIQTKLMAITREYGARVNADVAKQQKDAIEQMKKGGLKIITLSPEDRKTWNEMAAKAWPVVRGCPLDAPVSSCKGGVTSPEAFDEVLKLREEFRATQKGAAK